MDRNRLSSSPRNRLRRPLYAKLKPGPGRSIEEVFDNQRARLRTAVIELSAERGYEQVTVRSLAGLACVSTRTFYKHFANAEECFVDTYEMLMERSQRRACEAQRGASSWREGLRASLRSIFEDLAKDPKAGRLVLVDAFALGLPMPERMTAAAARYERLLRDSLPAARSLPRHLPAGIAAGVMQVARTRLLAGNSAEPRALADRLCEWAVSLVEGFSTIPRTAEPIPFRHAERYLNGEPSDSLGTAMFAEIGDERGRILSATAKLVAARGYPYLTISRIRVEAGVSRRRFDTHFRGVEDCLLSTVQAVVASSIARAGNREGLSTGPGAVYRGILSLCTEAARHPYLAHLAFVEIFAPGRGALELHDRLVAQAASHLISALPDRQPSRLLAEASSAAAWRIASTDIASGHTKELPNLAPLLTYVALLPVIGSKAVAVAIRDEPMPAAV